MVWQRVTAQAHILDKHKYGSVRYHPWNRLHLCPVCHDQFGSSWLSAKKMKVWPIAVQRYWLFRAEITEPLPDIFEQAA